MSRSSPKSPAYGLTGKKRYEAYRHALIEALKNGPLDTRQLSHKLNLGFSTLPAATRSKKGQLFKVLNNLLEINILHINTNVRPWQWSITNPAGTVFSPPKKHYRGQSRSVEDYKRLILDALKEGGQVTVELEKKIGVSNAMLHNVLHKKGGKIISQAVQELLAQNLITITGSRVKYWNLVTRDVPIPDVISIPPSELHGYNPGIAVSTPDNIDIAFQAFMEAVKAEAEKAASHKINSQKEAINKYIEIIKNLQSKPHQKQDQSLVKKFFNFQET